MKDVIRLKTNWMLELAGPANTVTVSFESNSDSINSEYIIYFQMQLHNTLLNNKIRNVNLNIIVKSLNANVLSFANFHFPPCLISL